MAFLLTDLRDFIARPRRWEWGECDCTLFAADWIVERTGIDPAAAIRGTYTTGDEADEIVARLLGIEALGDAMLAPLGIRRTPSPADGDIGVVEGLSEGTAKQMPGIRFGPLWAVMGPRGVVVKKFEWSGVAWAIL